MTIKAVDLFCGVGGLTCGLQKAGIPVVAGIDIDGSCEYAYTHNNHSQFIKKSIDEVTGKEVRALLRGADVKVLVGCAPCQPFSSHQKDKKHRSNHKDWKLLYQFSRLVKEVKPHIVSMENVPELQKEKVLKRKEIKIPTPTHERYITVREAIGNLPEVKAGEADKDDALHIAPALSSINLQRIRNSRPGGTWRDWPDALKLKCHKSEKGKTYASVYGRMRWDDLSPTITTQFIGYGTGRFGHPDQDRALTLREGAILQSFPPDYQFVPPEEPIQIRKIARHIGNAVPPRLGEIIGQSIISSLPKKRKKAVNKNEQGV